MAEDEDDGEEEDKKKEKEEEEQEEKEENKEEEDQEEEERIQREPRVRRLIQSLIMKLGYSSSASVFWRRDPCLQAVAVT